MPTYRVTDPASGKTVKLTGDSPPTEDELNGIFSSLGVAESTPEVTPKEPITSGMGSIPLGGGDMPLGLDPQAYTDALGSRRIAGAVAPHAPMAGMVAGQLAARGHPLGGIIGYAAGKQAQPLLEAYGKGQSLPGGLEMGRKAIMEDMPEGAIAEAGGRVAGSVIGGVIKGAGVVGKQILGSLTGTGKGAIEEAIKGSPKFKAALRGKIDGEDIVRNTHDALSGLKDARAAAYQSELASLATQQGSINITPLKQETRDLLKKYVRIDRATGQPDWTRSALGSEKSEGVSKIRQIVEDIEGWGSKPGDDTVLGLDMLKRQLDDFYADTSNARAFVASLRSKVKDLIVANAPNYDKMTKGYSEATKLIKDVESGLMMRKQGISGRIIADQTLRRLTSAMRDNFELRRELVNTLGSHSGQDIAGEVAGHAMSPVIPRGLSGSGLSVGAGMITSFFKPEILPLLVVSSPRVSAEFLMLFGKGLKETPGMTESGARFLSYLAANQER